MLADALTPVAISLSALLVVSGVAKLRDPTGSAALLATAQIPGGCRLVALLGAAELALGVVGLAAPSRASGALLAAAYLMFALISARALRAGAAGESCGCFGATDAPLSRAHVVANVAAAIAALACSASGSPHGVVWLAQQGLGVAAIALLACAAATTAWYAVFTLLPQALSAWAPEEAG
jgi:hypothetical protein